MEVKDLNEVIKYFKEYTSREDGKYYFHKENDNFKIVVTSENELYQLNTDHEPYGIELGTIDNIKIRFKSFTGENIEDITIRFTEEEGPHCEEKHDNEDWNGYCSKNCFFGLPKFGDIKWNG